MASKELFVGDLLVFAGFWWLWRMHDIDIGFHMHHVGVVVGRLTTCTTLYQQRKLYQTPHIYIYPEILVQIGSGQLQEWPILTTTSMPKR